MEIRELLEFVAARQDAGPPLLLYVDEIRQLEDEAGCVVPLERQLL
jgi:hypothetical protein